MMVHWEAPPTAATAFHAPITGYCVEVAALPPARRSGGRPGVPQFATAEHFLRGTDACNRVQLRVIRWRWVVGEVARTIVEQTRGKVERATRGMGEERHDILGKDHGGRQRRAGNDHD